MRKLASIKIPKLELEQMVLGLIIVGLPLIAFIWFDWRAAVTAAIITLIAVGLVELRYS